MTLLCDTYVETWHYDTIFCISQIKSLLRLGEMEHVQRIDVCPNDCIAYWDSKYLPEAYRHAHRTKCPKCDASRQVWDPTDNAYHAAKTIFFFPLGPFIRGLYARPDLVPFLYHDREDDRPSGHVTRSKGFQAKLRDNPHLADKRSLGLVGTTDGVPFFDDQRRGCWPFVVRAGNLPDSLSTHPANIHLHMLSPSEYLELDEDAAVVRRRVRAPKSLMPHMHILVDDYLRVYYKGVRCEDASIPVHQAGRFFRCKCILLFWTGDYPAQAAVSGTHSKCCHWCTLRAEWTPEITRGCWGGYRRYLPDGHPMKEYSVLMGTAEVREAPAMRTHDEFVAQGLAQESHTGYKKDQPWLTTGVKECSPLRFIPLFCLIRDVMPDLMHAIPGVWDRHITAMLKGKRSPAQPRRHKYLSEERYAELLRESSTVKDQLKSWALTKVVTQHLHSSRHFK